MGVMVYKEGEKPARIEPHEMEGYFSMGWVLDKSGKPAAEEVKAAKETATDLEQARLAYEHMFGKKPHHKMKLETILEELNGNQPVQPE
jgi:hypothetical protein